jgi:hypothetical protein
MTDPICRKSMMRCQTPGMCSPHGGCQPERGFESQHLDLGEFIDWVYALKTERDQLKAENEALRKDAERYRWLRQDDVVQYEISTKCSEEKMDAAIDAAMSKEASHD